MDPIRVFLVDDHALLRASLKALLGQLPTVEVVGEAGDGQEALVQIEQLRPDVVLTDIGMPRMNGLELAAGLHQQFPAVRVIFLTMHPDEEYVHEALRLGAVGYLLKDADTTELDVAIRAVAKGQSYLSPAVSALLIEDFRRKDSGEPGNGAAAELTPRQREVLRYIVTGVNTKGIARRLSLSNKTVETHRAQLMERLDIHDVAGLTRYAVRVGLVGAGDDEGEDGH